MEEERIFTFEWRVKNFSMCPVEFGKSISSPDIRVKTVGNTEWRLELFPRGSRFKDFMSCFLRCRKFSPTWQAFKIRFNISVFPQSSDRDFEKDYKRDLNVWGYIKLISIDRVLKEKDKYLPNDTLTVKCFMKCKSSFPRNHQEEILTALTRENSMNTNECSCETIIPVQTKSVTWPIRRYRTLPLNERITMPLSTAIKGIPSFYVTLIKTAKSVANIEITRKKDSDFSDEDAFVRCHVSVSNAPKDVTCSAEGESLLKSDTVWMFAALQNWSDLDDAYFKHTSDVLYLRFQFSYSIQGKFIHTERYDGHPDVFPQPSERPIPVDMLTRPSTDSEPSIVSLRSGDQSFQVHKSLLLASSEVFGMMFEIDMKEKVTGVVDIDVDPQTLRRMVAFLYSGSVGDLSATDCKALYVVAHKYQLQALVSHCSYVLRSLLTVSNVCDVLSFADFYRNHRLLKSVKDFIVDNSDRILVSPDWKSLMERNPSLAAKVMYKMLIK